MWFILARLTGFFWDNPAAQAAALVVLLVIIVGESLWAYMPGYGNQLREYTMDVLTSAFENPQFSTAIGLIKYAHAVQADRRPPSWRDRVKKLIPFR